MKSKDGESLIKPQPLKGFGQRTVLYVPMNLPSFKIQNVLKDKAKYEKITPMGHLYGFANSVVLAQCVGAPLAVMALERLIASGAKEIIILGFCGALDECTDIGQAVSVTKALSDEGTSKHYFSRKRLFRASSKLRTRVENTLADRALSFVNGPVVSTDAPFRETRIWLDRNRKKGIAYVDMETSAVFALAHFYGIHAAALHMVSDTLTSTSHRMGFHSLKLARNIQRYFLPFIDPKR
ncbi:MAG: nucleoside phosphorylase [Candidatus Aminicenantes bacterium]|jgi:uridine phosphorylase